MRCWGKSSHLELVILSTLHYRGMLGSKSFTMRLHKFYCKFVPECMEAHGGTNEKAGEYQEVNVSSSVTMLEV